MHSSLTLQSVGVLWRKQRHLAPEACYGPGPCERKENRSFTWHRKRKLMDEIGRHPIKRKKKTDEGSLKQASLFIQRPETDTMMSYGPESKAKSL